MRDDKGFTLIELLIVVAIIGIIALMGSGALVVTGPCAGAAMTAYYATAVPQTVGSSNTRGFATNNAFTIFQDAGGAAPTEPFTVAGTVSAIQ